MEVHVGPYHLEYLNPSVVAVKSYHDGEVICYVPMPEGKKGSQTLYAISHLPELVACWDNNGGRLTEAEVKEMLASSIAEEVLKQESDRFVLELLSQSKNMSIETAIYMLKMAKAHGNKKVIMLLTESMDIETENEDE